MAEFWAKVLLLIRPASVKLELFWSDTEVKYVKNHGIKTHSAVVGAFVADIYKDKKLLKKIPAKTELFSRHQLDKDKKLLLVSSPWGFIDCAPDNPDKSSHLCSQDAEARDKWCVMIKELHAHQKWNVLATLHPNLDIELYKKKLSPIPIDTSCTATELLIHSDYLIHSGSTMAVEMHWLNKPAFQFGDVNSLDMPDGNWWQRRGSAISQVSPYFIETGHVIAAIESTEATSNANAEAIRALEEGRYGKMDGKATERAAKLINQIEGEFKLYWPEPTLDYDQLFLFKNVNKIVSKIRCNICEKFFFIINEKWLKNFNETYKIEPAIDIPDDKACPHCAHSIARIQPFEQPLRNPNPQI